MRVIDIAWLAGIIEGEGSFAIAKGSPLISVQMTDLDVIHRIAELFGTQTQSFSRPRGRTKSGGEYKPVYTIRVHGVRAIQWMMTLYSLMGERRQAKIRAIVKSWTDSKAAARAPRCQRFMSTCHPLKPRIGQGLCRTCYMRNYRQRAATA